MDLQTRKLLSLLSEERTESILAALRGGPLTEKELIERVGDSQKTVNRHLHKLEETEVVAREASPPRKEVGVRPKVFRIVAEIDRELMRFCDGADDFALTFEQNRVARMKRRIEAERRKRLRSVETDEAA